MRMVPTERWYRYPLPEAEDQQPHPGESSTAERQTANELLKMTVTTWTGLPLLFVRLLRTLVLFLFWISIDSSGQASPSLSLSFSPEANGSINSQVVVRCLIRSQERRSLSLVRILPFDLSFLTVDFYFIFFFIFLR